MSIMHEAQAVFEDHRLPLPDQPYDPEPECDALPVPAPPLLDGIGCEFSPGTSDAMKAKVERIFSTSQEAPHDDDLLAANTFDAHLDAYLKKMKRNVKAWKLPGNIPYSTEL